MIKFSLADTSFHSSEKPISRCYLGKVLYVLSERSNWTGSCGFRDEDLDSLHLDLPAAVEWIRPRRKKGKSWHIWELPTVVVESQDRRKLLVSELTWTAPLDGYQFTLPRKKTFGALAKALMPACSSGQYGLRCTGAIRPAEFPFETKRTHSPEFKRAIKDSGDPMPIAMKDWESEYDVDARPSIRVVSKISLWLATP